jgi:hypothetical protein
MNFKPSNFVAVPTPLVAFVEQVVGKIAVYFRRDDGKLGQINVGTQDEQEAILEVKEALVASGEGWNAPVLAFIKGGKYVNATA